jgi:PAS domain-containing protein
VLEQPLSGIAIDTAEERRTNECNDAHACDVDGLSDSRIVTKRQLHGHCALAQHQQQARTHHKGGLRTYQTRPSSDFVATKSCFSAEAFATEQLLGFLSKSPFPFPSSPFHLRVLEMESKNAKERIAASDQRPEATALNVPLHSRERENSASLDSARIMAALHPTISLPGLSAAAPSSLVSAFPAVLAQASQSLLQQPTPEAVTAAAAATWAFMQQAMATGSGSAQGGAQIGSGLFPPASRPTPPPPPPPNQQQLHTLPSSHLLGSNGSSIQPLHSKPGVQTPLLPTPAAAAPLFQNPVPASNGEAVSIVSSQSLPAAPGTGRPVHAFTVESKKRRAEDSASSPLYASSEPSKSRNHVTSASVDTSSFCFDSLVPPQPKSDAEVAKMTPAERRRYERNLREQQRSYRISQQIKELRDVLAESNVPFKPNKFSILVSVTEYIKQLQSMAIMLDAEHHKLVTTISQSTDLAAQPPAGHSSSSEESERDPVRRQLSVAAAGGSNDSEQDLLMVRGIDYKSVFGRCPFALGVASLDGRVLACNEALERLLGCTQREMMEQSLFLFIRNHQEVFEAMAELLKRSSLGAETGELPPPDNPKQLLYWCGTIMAPSARKVGWKYGKDSVLVQSLTLLASCVL